jgi:hypothetical protein
LSLGGVAAAFIPVPFVNGFVAGSMMFLAGHEMVKHPDSAFAGDPLKPIAESRTWKRISAGAAISGMGWGLGLLAATSQIPLIMSLGTALGVLGGTALGFRVAYRG